MNVTVPKEWNKLTNWQIPRLAYALFFPQKNKRRHLLYIVLVLFLKKPTLKNLWQCCRLFNQVPLSELKTYGDFIFKEADLTKFINIKGLCGPMPRMTNLTINEFSYADTFYYRWTKNKKEVELDRLVAILYRKPIKGKRPKFKFSDTHTYAKQCRKISLSQKMAIFLAYQGSRNIIIKNHKHVFAKGSEKSKYTPFSKIVNNMATATPQPFGDFYKTQDALVYDFMKILNQQIADQNKQNKKRKK